MEKENTKSTLHTILGASGASGRALIAELLKKNCAVRAVQRSSNALEGVECVQANLLKAEQTMQAVAGSSHVYMCAAVEYNVQVWQRDWPVMIENVIAACLAADAVLVFLDNIYMYGPSPLKVPFDESHSQVPPSKKGAVRKQVADRVLEAAKKQGLKAVIARSADFYGPYSTNSLFYIQSLERMMAGKAPNSIAKPGVPHTFGNVTDNARAMLLLANEPDCYGQVYHLPVGEAITPEELIQLLNKELGTSFKPNFLPGFMRFILQQFIPGMKELKEMMYQFEHPYVMSWEKFKTQFPHFEATPYDKGIKEMVASFR